MANESSTREIFVGREAERNEFHLLLRQGSGFQVLYLHGGGGTGKTRLLEWMVGETRHLNSVLSGTASAEPGSALDQTVQALRNRNLQSIRVTENLVDFYKTGNHTPLGLLNDIANQLQLKLFLEYSRRFEAKGIETPAQLDEVRAQFSKEYQELAQENIIVLLFDTFEAAGPVGEILLNKLLPTQGPNTLLVIAGRRFPDNLQAQSRTLPPLTNENAIDFFRKRELTDQVITDQQIKQINEMVGGRPIYLALAIDWLSNAEGTAEKLLQPDPPEDLGQALVKHILQLKTPENTAILYLAYIWRLGEAGLLAHLLKMNETEMATLVEKLGRYSFIKYRKAEEGFKGSCLLHDEMRVLVQQHCWPSYDRTGENRKALTRSALEYYENILRQQEGDDVAQGRRRAKDPILRNYQAEWVYYQLQLDLAEGGRRMDTLFRDAAHKRDIAFCQQLLDELKRPEFWNALLPAVQADGDFKQALILYRNEKYDEAERYWLRITGPTSPNPKSRATALMLLTELYGDRGKTDLGIGCATEAQTAYKELLAQEPENMIFKRQLGELYNNWGRLMRVQDNFQAAIDYYRKTLDIYKEMPEDEINKGRARTLNNLGFVYYLLGDMTQAQILCGRAIILREKLDIKYELGLSYNTMGMIQETAGDMGAATSMYAKALASFDEAQSSYGRGLVLINYGRMHRVTKEFAEALKALHEAEAIFRRLDNKSYLAETLNELGSVYHARELPEDITKAEKYFRESLQYGGDRRMVDNLTDMAMMFAQAGKAQDTQACLAEAEPLINKLDDIYFRGQTHEIRASLYFAEGEKLKKERPDQAHDYLQRAFDTSLDAAATYVECMQRSFQFHRAGRRYRQVLNMIQRELDICSPTEISVYADHLKKRWATKNYASQYSELPKILDIVMDDVRYF